MLSASRTPLAVIVNTHDLPAGSTVNGVSVRVVPLPVSASWIGVESQDSANAFDVVTASLNVTRTSLPIGTLAAPLAGCVETTVGGCVAGSSVVNDAV